MFEFFMTAAECDKGVTWPHVAAFGILVLGIVATVWAVTR